MDLHHVDPEAELTEALLEGIVLATAAEEGGTETGGLIEPAELSKLMFGFLRQRQQEERQFLDVELEAVVTWAQNVRLDATLLSLVDKGLVGIRFDGLDLAMVPLPDDVEQRAAGAGMVLDDDPDRTAVVAYCTVAWAAGLIPNDVQIRAVREWVHATRANSSLLEAFLCAPGATIDRDRRGRIIIMPPERP